MYKSQLLTFSYIDTLFQNFLIYNKLKLNSNIEYLDTPAINSNDFKHSRLDYEFEIEEIQSIGEIDINANLTTRLTDIYNAINAKLDDGKKHQLSKIYLTPLYYIPTDNKKMTPMRSVIIEYNTL